MRPRPDADLGPDEDDDLDPTIRAARTLSIAQWSRLVSWWNGRSQKEMAQAYTTCRHLGHDWIAYPLPGLICRRCLSYDRPGREP